MIEKFFKFKENKTDFRTEVVAGITTFMTMAYILAVNPNILSASGMDRQAVMIATALASFVGTITMALLANYPFALAPGLGLNAYFAYTVCGQMGYSWQFALLAVFVEGVIFLFLSLSNIREMLFNSIPLSLKKGISVGIGLFCAFIGLQNAHIIVGGPTLVTLTNFKDPATFSTAGISALLAVLGILLLAVLYAKEIKGSILISIFATWILGIICQLAGIYKVTPDAGYFSLLPAWSSFDLTSINKIAFQCFNFDKISFKIVDFVVVIFAFLYVDMFDTLGTLIGVATKADMLDKDGKLPKIKQALLSDSIATSVGAVLGTSTTTTFVESSAGVAAGGRTGFASVVTAVLFLLSVFLAPVFTAIPGFATAPALVFVGFLMVSAITGIKFDDLTESVPAYLALLTMPLTYSISDGIAFGVISYVVINVCCGKAKRISPVMYVMTVLFVLKYIVL